MFSRRNLCIPLLGIVLFQLSIISANPVGEKDTDNLPTLVREPRANKKVSPMLDKINVDTYLRNKKAVNQQIKCVLKDGPCDAVGKEIKKLIPIVLHDSNVCTECTESQLAKIQTIIDHLQTNYPKEWAEGVGRFGEPVGF